jgi:hypothetical protein
MTLVIGGQSVITDTFVLHQDSQVEQLRILHRVQQLLIKDTPQELPLWRNVLPCTSITARLTLAVVASPLIHNKMMSTYPLAALMHSL